MESVSGKQHIEKKKIKNEQDEQMKVFNKIVPKTTTQKTTKARKKH